MLISKRLLSVMLALVMIFSTVCVFGATADFYDLNKNHWAYGYIERLVSDGTINGHEDGSFKPEDKVTRAEFVKMIGKTDKRFDFEFRDVSQSEWYYDYVMYSDMDISDIFFYPEDYITRDDCLKLLWKRAGSDKSLVTPSLISSQGSNEYAVSWGYVYGIMCGDDGVDLRLDDGLTRSEAAALICRSRDIKDSDKCTLTENLNYDLLRAVYNFFFDDEYIPSKTFTNDEFAEIVLKLATDRTFVTYSKFNIEPDASSKTSIPLRTVCKYAIGESKNTPEFAKKNVNRLDGITELMFALDYKVLKNVEIDLGKTYPDVPNIDDKNAKRFISYAYANGIKIDNSDLISPDADFTAEDFVITVLQLDNLAGFYSEYVVTKDKMYSVDSKFNKSVYSYPKSSGDFRCIISGIPQNVYEEPFTDENAKAVNQRPIDSFRFARDYSSVFEAFLQKIASVSSSYGADVKFTYYPSLVVKCDTGYVIRVKIDVLKANSVKFSDAFATNTDIDKVLESGMSFYADIATGSQTDGLTMPVSNAVFTKIIS